VTRTDPALDRRFIELLDSQDWDAVRAHVSPSIRAHVGTRELDLDAWNGLGRLFYGAFPDGRHVIERQLADGDCVVTLAEWSGTHQGDFMGLAATGRKVRLPLILVDRFEDGRLVEHWGQFDSGALLQQLT